MRNAVVLIACLGSITAARGGGMPPPDYTVAFIGDQGLGPDSVAVLELIAAEGTDAIVHAGDFDYVDDPAAWITQIDSVLGAGFPYFACVGNHDEALWCAPGGYQERLEARLQAQGIAWSGDLGVQSTIEHQGLVIVLTAPGVYGCGNVVHDRYVRQAFGATDTPWRIASWHKNMTLMQVGSKPNETGWGVYEQARRAGAIIATGHEHSYSRTHLMSSMKHLAVASTSSTLALARDHAGSRADEGRSFCFVSGLAGRSIREQLLDGWWWASIYTETQNATHGALFGRFHVDGDPCRAHFYFKNIDGDVIDDFQVVTTIGPCGDGALTDGDPPVVSGGICGQGPCPADVTGDGFVNGDDVDLLIESFGCCEDLGDCPGDVFRNGFVGPVDLLEVFLAWGTCPNVNTCPWDLTGDDEVDWIDLAIVLDHFGDCDVPGPETCPWDFDGDGETDWIDVAILTDNWGDCP